MASASPGTVVNGGGGENWRGPGFRVIKCADVNDHISCKLCKGYLIDATTIIECLHSFCRTCILKHIKTNSNCPSCEIQIHKTKPILNLRPDRTLQDIVYKLIPNLFKNEMSQRKEFYKDNSTAASLVMSAEERGEMRADRIIYSPDDFIPISIEYVPEILPLSKSNQAVCPKTEIPPPTPSDSKYRQKRYLKCVAGVRIWHIKKLLRQKYELKYHHDVEMFYKHDPLRDEYSIVDLAYIFSWRRNGPIALYYKISDLRTITKRSSTPLQEMIQSPAKSSPIAMAAAIEEPLETKKVITPPPPKKKLKKTTSAPASPRKSASNTANKINKLPKLAPKTPGMNNNGSSAFRPSIQDKKPQYQMPTLSPTVPTTETITVSLIPPSLAALQLSLPAMLPKTSPITKAREFGAVKRVHSPTVEGKPRKVQKIEPKKGTGITPIHMEPKTKKTPQNQKQTAPLPKSDQLSMPVIPQSTPIYLSMPSMTPIHPPVTKIAETVVINRTASPNPIQSKPSKPLNGASIKDFLASAFKERKPSTTAATLKSDTITVNSINLTPMQITIAPSHQPLPKITENCKLKPTNSPNGLYEKPLATVAPIKENTNHSSAMQGKDFKQLAMPSYSRSESPSLTISVIPQQRSSPNPMQRSSPILPLAKPMLNPNNQHITKEKTPENIQAVRTQSPVVDKQKKLENGDLIKEANNKADSTQQLKEAFFSAGFTVLSEKPQLNSLPTTEQSNPFPPLPSATTVEAITVDKVQTSSLDSTTKESNAKENSDSIIPSKEPIAEKSGPLAAVSTQSEPINVSVTHPLSPSNPSKSSPTLPSKPPTMIPVNQPMTKAPETAQLNRTQSAGIDSKQPTATKTSTKECSIKTLLETFTRKHTHLPPSINNNI